MERRITIQEFYNTHEVKALSLPKSTNSKKAILGIGCLSHDTSAALIDGVTGNIIFAQSEERESNLKHDSGFPIASIKRAINFAIQDGFSINNIALNFNPDLFLYEGILGDGELFNNSNFKILNETIFELTNEEFTSGEIDKNRLIEKVQKFLKELNIDFPLDFGEENYFYLLQFHKYSLLGKIIRKLFPELPVEYVRHHDSHAASALFNFGATEKAAVLVLDGHGETDSCSIYDYNGSLKRVSTSSWPYSLGSLYLSATRHLNYDYGDEYKVMGMAAYGEPVFFDLLNDCIFVDKISGQLTLKKNKYIVSDFVRNTGQKRLQFTDSFSEVCQPRIGSSSLSKNDFNLASSIQKLTEQIGLDLANYAYSKTEAETLFVSGGVGLNGLMNNKIKEESKFEKVSIFPASGDDGTSVGAAQNFVGRFNNPITHSFYGIKSTENEILSALNRYKLVYSKSLNINQKIAELLYSGQIVARFNGRAEFGPRALGNRSILANPTISNMKDILNKRIKHRESFRPFAPAILMEDYSEYFYDAGESPFMLQIVKARQATVNACPAIVHEDGTSRVQTVSVKNNADFYRTIQAFKELTNLPMVVNTSFNVNGEAIVNSAEDAIESFLFMDIDYLAIGDYLVAKNENLGKLDKTHSEYLNIRIDRYFNMNKENISKIDCRKYGDWYESR